MPIVEAPGARHDMRFGPKEQRGVTAAETPARRSQPRDFSDRRWAYLTDVGETMALLAVRDASLAGFEVLHFRGHWFERGIDMAEAIRAVVADPHLPIRSMPWRLVGAASPFVPLMREL